jgi:hypothetical protein
VRRIIRRRQGSRRPAALHAPCLPEIGDDSGKIAAAETGYIEVMPFEDQAAECADRSLVLHKEAE